MYLSTDPIGLEGGLRPHSYVHNPNTWIDPLGLAECSTQVLAARERQYKMLQDDVGYNVSPFSFDHYNAIGKEFTYLTDRAAIENVIGKIRPRNGNITITRRQANELENQLGLKPGSLSKDGGFNIRQVQGINARGPGSPWAKDAGNELFRGGGQHLPGGGPELVIPPIPTAGGDGISIIGKVIVE